MTKLKCALVGAGRIAQTHAETITRCEEVELAAVIDSNAEAAQNLAERHNSKPFRSLQALFNESLNLDFAIICTPPATHHHLAITCLEEGLHVLCEKPFAIHAADAQEMVEAAKRHKRLLTMASKFRYVPEIKQAKQIIEQGILGDIIFFENVFTSHVDMRERWNSNPRVSGGGVLIDNGAHSLDIARNVFGELTEIQVLEGKRAQNLAVEDTVQINVRTTGHTLGRVDLSWSIQKPQDAYLAVFGAHGTLMVGWKESKYQLHGQPGWSTFGQGYDKYRALTDQLLNFARAVRGEEKLEITAEDGLASVLAVEAAYQSLRQFLWATIPGIPCRCNPTPPPEPVGESAT